MPLWPAPAACPFAASPSSCSEELPRSGTSQFSPGTEFLMAIAGPAVSVVLATVSGSWPWSATMEAGRIRSWSSSAILHNAPSRGRSFCFL